MWFTPTSKAWEVMDRLEDDLAIVDEPTVLHVVESLMANREFRWVPIIRSSTIDLWIDSALTMMLREGWFDLGSSERAAQYL